MKTTIHLTEEEIAIGAEAIIAGNLADQEPRIRQHLDQCASCAAEVMMVAELSGEVPDMKHNQNNSIPVWRYVAVLAAAIALLVLVFNVPGWFTSPNNRSIEMALVVKDSVKIRINQQNQIQEDATVVKDITSGQSEILVDKSSAKSTLGGEALAYAPNESLENLVSQQLAAYRSDEVIMLLSSADIQFPETDLLTWQNPEKILLTIEWYNNQGDLIQTSETHEDGIPIPVLVNGLYYWKLMNEDFDLLGVGKVVVKE